MILIIDNASKKVITNMGTNSIYPDGEALGIELRQNEELIKIHDNSAVAQKIQLAMPGYYELIFDGFGNVVDIDVSMSIADYWAQKEPTVTTETIDEEKAAMAEAIIDMETRLSVLEVAVTNA